MPFTGDHTVCFCQGRRGEVYVYQGYGNRGKVWSPSTGAWRDAGLAGPTELATAAHRKPTITASAGVKYYVARIDITESGSGYGEPPAITIAPPPGATCGSVIESPGTPVWYNIVAHPNTITAKCATAISRLQDGSVSIAEIVDYGKGFSAAPSVLIAAPSAMLSGATVLAPPAITTNVNNYNPGTADIFEISGTLDPTVITGWAAPAVSGKTILVKNVGTKYISLPPENLSSTAANRFTSAYLGDMGILPGRQASMTYDSATSRWKVSGTSSSDGDNGQGNVQATAKAIVRAHLRGKYRCYFRYVNDTVPESEGGPIYSNLSEVTEIDCGNGKDAITWSGTGITGSSYAVEFWRTTSNQATTLFRVAKRRVNGTYEYGAAYDNLTDWELIDPDRDGFAAMPILLPTGELNANRFGVPPSNYSVAVMFQDRLWMAVDTSGSPITNANVLRFSEADEPESMPEVNELILQSNLRDSDYITALVPFAGHLVVGQSRHCHRLSYNAQPLMDAAVSMMAYRGICNQRCWDIYDGSLYAMDDTGVYSLSPQGEVEDLSMGLADLWVDQIDFSLSQWFSLRVDRRLGLLRVNVAVAEDGSTKYPSRQYVYNFDYKTWWEERYPEELTSATEVRLAYSSGSGVSLVYGTSGGALRQLSYGLVDHAAGSIATITITNPGRGYKTPPSITANGGHGATFECGLDTDGRITGIVIKTPGTQYSAGSLVIAPPPTGGTAATATYTINFDGTQPVYWSYKSGAFEYTTDTQDKRGGETQNRQCSVTYQPTASSCVLNLQTYYNNAKYPRSNVVRRDRGTGFVHSDTVPAATIDMQVTPLQEAESHAVARAVFAGRALDDMMGTDRHVSVALSGKQNAAGEVVIHTLDIYGVNDKKG